MVYGDVYRMGRIVFSLWWLLSYWPLLAEEDQVLVSRAWLTVEELMACAGRQSGEPHHSEVVDHLKQMVLYDHLTTAKEVREAVLEYYTYVLGERVLWQRHDESWRLIEEKAVEVGSRLMAEEQEPFISSLFYREVSFPFAVHQPSLPGFVWLPLDGVDQSASKQNQYDSQVVVPTATILMDIGPLSKVEREEESVGRRRSPDRQSPMGLPLSVVSFSGGDGFSMCPSPDESEALFAAYESKVMGDAEAQMDSMIAAMEISAREELEPIVVSGHVSESGTGPAEGSLDLKAGPEAVRLEEDEFSGPITRGGVQQSNSSPPNIGKRWLRLTVPKHILSFSPKRLVARLKEMRMDHPQEEQLPKPSKRTLFRRKQAQSLFDEVSDWVSDKRRYQKTRRGR